jgi:protein-tyrosine phosphatase
VIRAQLEQLVIQDPRALPEQLEQQDRQVIRAQLEQLVIQDPQDQPVLLEQLEQPE